jgi:hypothetical protein
VEGGDAREGVGVKVFITWSGALSEDVASALNDFLPDVIQTIRPFFSSDSVRSGQRWFEKIGAELEMTTFGLAVVTKDNHDRSPWLYYEAGALARETTKAQLAVFLVDLSPRDLRGPLEQYQATAGGDQDDVFKLFEHLNELCEPRLPPDRLKRQFGLYWPTFAERRDRAVEKHTIVSLPPSAKSDELEALDRLTLMTRDLASQVEEIQKQMTRSVLRAPDPMALKGHWSDVMEAANTLRILAGALTNTPDLATAERLEKEIRRMNSFSLGAIDPVSMRDLRDAQAALYTWQQHEEKQARDEARSDAASAAPSETKP